MDLVNEPVNLQGNKHEVFLSYTRRGEDTRDSFRSRLCSSMREAKISVFKDHIYEQSIIEGSKILIIIFSKHYASSERCLRELTKIMEFRRAYDQVVLPIFYGVDRSEVQVPNQESSFGRALQRLTQGISLTEVSRRRTALYEVGGLRGFVVPNFESKNGSEDIQNIVKHVRHILDRKDSFDTNGLVEVSSQVKEVITMLQKHQSKDFVSIGIWGMAGIGKTTIAGLIFNYIQYEFESTCFLSIVSEEWKREGKVYMQRQLLSAVREATDMEIDNIESASLESELKKRLPHKKVLLVLDDVNYLEQLHALCASPEWFSQGSRIIITTEDSRLLKPEAFKVDDVYSMKLLTDHASLELFNRTTFKHASPEPEFKELSIKVVAHAEGLPLALEDLGSALQGQPLMTWESMLVKLSIIPPPATYNKLKCSFDSLEGNEKEIFLNIVLFYFGEDMDDVIQKLDSRGCDARVGIKILVDQSIITIDNNNKLRMHNMLQLMGRQLIHEIPRHELLKRDHGYDVFLSFRGEDTRTNFTSHLYLALKNAGIKAFIDSVDLPRGKHIKIELLQAIGTSKISIIIFSEDYGGSKWCLEELSIIMELCKSKGQVVLPVFYHVEPKDVRHQTNSFGKAFDSLVDQISPPEAQVALLSRWSKALREAGEISGYSVGAFRDDAKMVTTIVNDAYYILDKNDLIVAEHPVGVDGRVQEVVTMLQKHRSEGVVMVGIWGMGGIGKTTIAKAIYNKIGPTFESRSYLSKVRKNWHEKSGRVSLQNQLLQDICKRTKKEISNTELGKKKLSYSLRHKKSLVLLDDVDKQAQLKALVGSPDWFGQGSTIIITTRNKRLLLKMGFHVYMMKHLDKEESIELFSWHAFNQGSPKKGFIELSNDVVACSGGLPLALKELGSYCIGREACVWKSMLKKLERIPNHKIQKKLEISFNGLEDFFAEEVFLDISCFFIGMDKNDVIQILNGCNAYADDGIINLEEKSLLTVDEENKLGMHDLLRNMGREIIRKRSKKLGKRSRLWFCKDAQTVLIKYKGTNAIEGLSMKSSKRKIKHFRTKAFRKMKKLRLLHLENVQLIGDYKYISESLRWLCWHGFPIQYIPSNFCQRKLVVIDLKCSSLKQVWREPQVLKKLKILNLSYSCYLVRTPDFSNLPNLEKLILKNCEKLSRIHDSIGVLKCLVLIDLEDCIGLHSLPINIYKLKRSLKTLILSGCNNIENLEKVIEQMEYLTTLMAPTIKQGPFSLVRSKSISYPIVYGHEGLSHHVTSSLFVGTSTIPSESNLQGHPSATGYEILDPLCSTNCLNISTGESCMGHLLIQIGKNCQVFGSLSKSISQGLNLTKCSDDCIFPGDKHPYWLVFMDEGKSVKFKVPPVNGHDHLKGMTICCLYFPSSDLRNKACDSCMISLMIKNYTKRTTLVYTEDKLTSLKETEMKEIISNPEYDNEVEVKADFRNGFMVKKMVVYLIYNESFDEQTDPLPSTIIGTKHKCEVEEEANRPRKARKLRNLETF